MAVIECEKRNGVAFVTINRPENLNAINLEVIETLDTITKDLKQQNNIHVVVLTGSGTKAFAAGADIKAMASMSPAASGAFSAYGIQVFENFGNLPQVTISKVNGFALGGGLELALSADFIVCSEAAVFGLPEATLGLVPGFGGSQRLAERIGVAKAIEWAVTGGKYTAQQALHSGLVNSVYTSEEFDPVVEKMVANILRNGPCAIKAVKNLIRNGSNRISDVGYKLESAQFGLMFSTKDAKEGMAAFVEKRKPIYAGE